MKITVARLLETGKLLATKSGQELADLINYVNDTTAEFARVLRGGLSYADNFNCIVRTYSIKHNTEQIIFTDNKIPFGIQVQKVVSTTTGVDSFIWFNGNDNQTRVKIGLIGAPTEVVDVVLLITF